MISVLIAAYRAGAFLPSALASISVQTHSDWELVVVEDGSHDATETLVWMFAKSHPGRRVHYENLGENLGVAAARNRLLDLARGDALAFLDADDCWQPHHLADLAQALGGGAALAFTGIEWWDGAAQSVSGSYLPPTRYLSHPRVSLFQHSFIQTSSCVALTRLTVERTGRFDESLRIGEDRDYWFRVAFRAPLVCTGRISCRYTKHAGSSMSQTSRVAADTVAFYRKHREASDVPSALRRSCLAQALTNQGRLLRSRAPHTARGLFREAVQCQPWRADRWPWLVATLFSRPRETPTAKAVS